MANAEFMRESLDTKSIIHCLPSNWGQRLYETSSACCEVYYGPDLPQNMSEMSTAQIEMFNVSGSFSTITEWSMYK